MGLVYPRHLRERDIAYRLGGVGQKFLGGVADDPDDACRGIGVAAQQSADRIDSGKVLLCERFVDHDNSFGIAAVCVSNRTSLAKRYANALEIARRNNPVL